MLKTIAMHTFFFIPAKWINVIVDLGEAKKSNFFGATPILYNNMQKSADKKCFKI